MSRSPARNNGRWLIAGLVVVLIVLHQDNWFWDSESLVLGIFPIGLFYHCCISLAAAAVWFLATKIAWPVELIEEAEQAKQEREGAV